MIEVCVQCLGDFFKETALFKSIESIITFFGLPIPIQPDLPLLLLHVQCGEDAGDVLALRRPFHHDRRGADRACVGD